MPCPGEFDPAPGVVRDRTCPASKSCLCLLFHLGRTARSGDYQERDGKANGKISWAKRPSRFLVAFVRHPPFTSFAPRGGRNSAINANGVGSSIPSRLFEFHHHRRGNKAVAWRGTSQPLATEAAPDTTCFCWHCSLRPRRVASDQSAQSRSCRAGTASKYGSNARTSQRSSVYLALMPADLVVLCLLLGRACSSPSGSFCNATNPHTHERTCDMTGIDRGRKHRPCGDPWRLSSIDVPA